MPLKRVGRVVREVQLSRDGHELYVLGLTSDRLWQVSVVDTSSGTIKTRVDFGPPRNQRVSASLFASCGDLIPVVTPEPPEVQEDGRKRWTNLFRVVFHARHTGEPIDDLSLPVLRKDGKLHGVRQVPVVKANTFILTSNEGVMAFGHEENRP